MSDNILLIYETKFITFSWLIFGIFIIWRDNNQFQPFICFAGIFPHCLLDFSLLFFRTLQYSIATLYISGTDIIKPKIVKGQSTLEL